jgi:Ras-related protein Rab-1A
MDNLNCKLSTPLYKILILGDSAVGKTCLKKRYVDSVYNCEYSNTIGVDYKTKLLNVENKLIKLSLWDTAGQEKYRAITKSYFANTHGIVLCFDITNRSSFDDLDYWLEMIKNSVRERIAVILVGTKADRDCERTVSSQEAKMYSKKVNIKYFETSALAGMGVDEAFNHLAVDIIKNDEYSEILSTPIKLEIAQDRPNKSCC